MLFYDHEHTIESCAGVQQGDPLGPLYFCCGIMAMVNDIQAMNPVDNKWYYLLYSIDGREFCYDA